jgi:hypothetical protein
MSLRGWLAAAAQTSAAAPFVSRRCGRCGQRFAIDVTEYRRPVPSEGWICSRCRRERETKR